MMKKIICILLTAALLLAALPVLASSSAMPPMTWADVRAQLDKGAEIIRLTSAVSVPAGETLSVEGTLTIDGAGFALSGGLTVEKGTVIFKDVNLSGANGINAENGRPALIVRDGAIAVLSGASSAAGGRAGSIGMRGGDGVLLEGESSGLILRGSSHASGGMGMNEGGCGVKAEGCGASVIITDTASVLGGSGMHVGGSGLNAPGCVSMTASVSAQMAGGNATLTGGDGLCSLACERCGKAGPVAISDNSVFVGGIGAQGGSALKVRRDAPAEKTDVTVSGAGMFFGGTGRISGYAMELTRCSVAFEGTLMAVAGGFSESTVDALALGACDVRTGVDCVLQTPGSQISGDPTFSVAGTVYNALQQVDEASRFQTVESMLDPEQMRTTLGKLKTEKSAKSQVYLGGSAYKTTLWNATYEKKLQIKTRLMECEDGVRMVLIAQDSPEYLTMDSTLAALKKYHSLGVTELALTMTDPVYYERVLALGPLLEAVEAYGADKVERIMIGTADDCVIFVLPDGAWDYQETLLPTLLR